MANNTEKARDLVNQAAALNKAINEQKNSLDGVYKAEQQRYLLSAQIAENEKAIRELIKMENVDTEKKAELLKELVEMQGEVRAQEEKINKELKTGLNARQAGVDIARAMVNSVKEGWKFLQLQDKVIKSTILSLGMSGAKAAEMRGSFEESAGLVARMGGNLEDIQTIMQGYADETGRARSLSAEMVTDITAIGKGTGLGVEQATKLGAQFELMGYDAKGTMEYVQGVVDTSERMGVNTTKVLKNVSDNFKRLNTYTFQQGVKGFAQMAMYAEKFRIDIGQALNAADVARSLEGAVDLAANLQVMGGEFAKTDPFEMLFLSRNDPAKFTEKIADMTKGIVSFRRMADGSFEKFISPADRDRLASVAKSLGMEASELTQIAERQAEIQKMRQQMAGMGLSDKEKELIEGAAVFNQETGKFEAKLGGQMRDISKLTEAQARSFAKESKSLQDRALEAQTFDEAFKATINELKAALLPILNFVNGTLTAIRPTVIKLTEIMTKGPGAWLKVGALFLTTAVAFKASGIFFGKMLDNFVSKSKLLNIFSKSPAAGRGGVAGGTDFITKGGAIRKGAGGLAAGQGMKALGKGAGIGAAAVGLGAGVGLAAEGISKLADSMAKLTPEQAESLQKIAMTLAITFPAAAIGIGLVAGAATTGAIGLLALGAAVVGVGFGINLAAKGIGIMSKGLTELVMAGKDAGPAMLQTGKGIAFVAASMMGFTAGAAGFLVFAGTMKMLQKSAPALATIGDSFANIKAVLSGSKDDFIAVQRAIESISKSNIKGGGFFADLTNIMNKPLKVEFADKQLDMISNITLNIDGERFTTKAIKAPVIIKKSRSLFEGKGDQNV
ncbi:MAG: hypothetical protein WC333_01030 [Dehalococcoidia bacterium]|jgi:hypothetical protein